MAVTVEPLLDPPGEREIEIVEHKGIGHPDTICDALAEEFGIALCRYHRERFGAILHHNVDKVLLVGGASRPRFGGGEVVDPITVHLSGRAHREHRGARIPVEDLAWTAAHGWLRRNVPELDLERGLRLVVLVRQGAAELTDLFAAGAATPLANDTSCGVGFAPPTPLERAVLAVGDALRAERARSPHLGADVKVLGVRRHDAVHLTVAAAMVGRHVADLDDYRAKVAATAELALAAARPLCTGEVTVRVNAADDLARGRCYLTVTGTSAEAGDDGEAGRGNRVGGLITPCRPMTMESVAGKNPTSHVGKLYNVLAHLTAAELADAFPDLLAVEVLLASRIGAPIDAPQLACVRARTRRHGDLDGLAAPIAAHAEARITTAPHLWHDLLERRHRLF